MDEFREIYLDETDEQLDELTAALAQWNDDRPNATRAREVLRLIHAMEGAAGAMEFESVRAATQFFDREFVRARDRDLAVAPLVRHVEFLRTCNGQLRRGEPLGSSTDLVEQMKQKGRG